MNQSCYKWIEEKVRYVYFLSGEEFNRNISVKETGGFYWMFGKQLFTTNEIEETFPKLEKRYNVKILWSSHNHGIGIKKLQYETAI